MAKNANKTKKPVKKIKPKSLGTGLLNKAAKAATKRNKYLASIK
ncbi:hypothetical protein [Sulfurovum sp.]